MITLFQNVGSTDFTLGVYSIPHNNTNGILVMNALYIVLWTWLLNWICTINPNISWAIIFLPIILLFVALGIILIQGREGMCATCGQGAMSQLTF
jgi:succinate-acetate transporter protein